MSRQHTDSNPILLSHENVEINDIKRCPLMGEVSASSICKHIFKNILKCMKLHFLAHLLLKLPNSKRECPN